MLVNLLRRLFPQDDFAGNWYGWLTNQISHIGLGVLLTIISCGVYFHLAGEFPVKWQAWALISALYLWSEVARGWAGWDSVEDSVFVCLYGSGGAFLAFSEVTRGSPVLVTDLTACIMLASIMAVHLAVGTYTRGRDA